jgi:hypothetical protein
MHEGQKPRPLQLNGHQLALGAPLAFQPGKTAAEEPTVEVCLQFLAGVLGDAHRERPVIDRAVQRREVVAHNLVERRRLRAMALVDVR